MGTQEATLRKLFILAKTKSKQPRHSRHCDEGSNLTANGNPPKERSNLATTVIATKEATLRQTGIPKARKAAIHNPDAGISTHLCKQNEANST